MESFDGRMIMQTSPVLSKASAKLNTLQRIASGVLLGSGRDGVPDHDTSNDH